jgi:sarcosine oxidase subunit beta
MSTGASDVVVVGGGLHGLSSAFWLARAGASVTVIEQDTVGRHASGWNAGGVRRLGRDPAELPLAERAHALWPTLAGLLGSDCGFKASLQVRVAEHDDAMPALAARAAVARDAGFAHEVVIDQSELRRLLPGIAPHCVGGLVVHGDGFADPALTCDAFRRACERLGVRIREGERVTALSWQGAGWTVRSDLGVHAAAAVVNAGGAWAARFADALDEAVPARAAALMMSATEPLPPFLNAVVGCHGRALSLKQMADGSAWIGGAVEGRADLDARTCALDEDALAGNRKTACDLFPSLARARIVRTWAGIEAMTPDALPVLGPSKRHERLFHTFGYSAHGFQLAPVTGRVVAALVAGESPQVVLERFAIDRFQSGEGSNDMRDLSRTAQE